MEKKDLGVYRQRLSALRSRLRGDVSHMTDAALNQSHSEPSRMPTHLADLGSENFDQELTLSLLSSEENALDQIEAALNRLEEGTYGQCTECGGKISKPRLEAIPYAALCVHCAAQRERGGES